MRNRLKLLNDLLRVFESGDDSYTELVHKYKFSLIRRLETKFHNFLKYTIDNLLYNNKVILFFKDSMVEVGNLISISPFNHKTNKEAAKRHYSVNEALNLFEETVAKGDKRHLVLLYEETDKGLQKIDPQNKGRNIINLLAIIPFIIPLSTFWPILLMIKNIFNSWALFISWALSFALSIITMLILMLYIFGMLSKNDITGRKIYKIDIQIMPATPREKIDYAISLLTGINYTNLEDALNYINASLKASIDDALINVEEYEMPTPPGIRIYLDISKYCNAFSMGFPRKAMAISSKMLACMNNIELSAVINHELSHIRRNDSLKMIIFVLTTNSLGVGLFYVFIVLGWIPTYIYMFDLAYMAASILISKQINKLMELRADRDAISGDTSVNVEGVAAIKGLLASLMKVGYPSTFREQSIRDRIKSLADDHPTTERRIVNALRYYWKTQRQG